MPEKEPAKSFPCHLPLTDSEYHGLKVVAAMNGWTIREQVAQYVQEGVKRDFPAIGGANGK